MSKKIKLCYAINEYNTKTDTHYKACYEMLEQMSKKIDIFLYLEKKCSKVNLPIKEYYVSKFNNSILKFLENFLILVYVRLKGYNRFYSHYTTYSRINMGLISRLSFAKSYHWHCGVMKLFKKNFEFSFIYFYNKFFREFLEILSWRINHYLVTGNYSMKKHYTIDFNVPREKIKILPNWIDFNKFNKSKFNVFKIKKELNIKENQKVMLFVHRVVERKGAHFLVPIIFNLIEKNPNILLIVCGDGPYMQKLKLEIKKNNLEKYFLILGKVPNDEIPKYFAVSDLFLMPSLEEGFPHVLLESLAMNVPYVAADVGGVKEISPNILKGFVLDIVDLNLFSLNILNILDNLEILEFNYRNYVIKTFSFKEAQKIFLKNLEK